MKLSCILILNYKLKFTNSLPKIRQVQSDIKYQSAGKVGIRLKHRQKHDFVKSRSTQLLTPRIDSSEKKASSASAENGLEDTRKRENNMHLPPS